MVEGDGIGPAITPSDTRQRLFVAAELRPRLRALFVLVQDHTASGGRLIRIASMLPPVLSPNSVPRS